MTLTNTASVKLDRADLSPVMWWVVPELKRGRGIKVSTGAGESNDLSMGIGSRPGAERSMAEKDRLTEVLVLGV